MSEYMNIYSSNYDLWPSNIPTPKLFVCPLTKRLMTHPVIDREGNSYEKDAVMTYLRRQAGNRGISPITSNPLHEKDLTDNKGLSMAIDAALQNALKEETLLHNDKKQSQLKKSKSSRRMPRMTSKKFSSSIKLVGKELKSGAGLINELMEPAKKGVDKVLGPPIHSSKSDTSDQFIFDTEDEGEKKKEFTPQTISSAPTRRKGRHTPRTMERQSMTTGNSALDARIAAFQHSAEDGSIISGSRLTIDSSTRSLKSADSKDSFEERIAAKCKANDNNNQKDITKSPREDSTADNAFEERLRRKMSHQDSISSTAAQSISSYESKLQRKLSKSISNTSSSHDAQQSLDSYESKLQRKLSKSVSNTSDSYESKLQRELSGANSTSSRRIDESSSMHSTAQQSLDSYESKLQRKLSKSVGNASSSTARNLGKEELDAFERKVQKKLNSSSNTNVSSEKEELDDFEKKLQRKLSRSMGANNSSTARDIGKEVDDYESRLKKKLSTVSNSSSVPPQDQTGNTKAERSYEERLRRKLSGGSSERQLESSSKEQAPIKRIDSFEERIQAKCRANEKKASFKVKDNQEEEEVQQTNRVKSRRSMLDEKIKMSMTKKNTNITNQGKEDINWEKSDTVKSRRDIFDEKLKQSATSKKKEKKSKKKSKATESTSKKSSKDDAEDKERRRRKRRAKAEKVRASLKSVDSDQSKEIHRSSPSRLTIDEDKEGISEILCSDGKHRPRPSMPQESDAASFRHISDLTIDDEDDGEPIGNDVSWGELDDALLTAQNMSMKVTSSDDAQKIQKEVGLGSWDEFDEEAIAKAQNMSMKVAATDASKLQAELLSDSGEGRENQGPIVAERKARGRRGGEKNKQTKGKDSDKPRQPQLEQAQLILAAKVDKLLPIVSEYGKSKLDVLNALQETKYDEEKALALLLEL